MQGVEKLPTNGDKLYLLRLDHPQSGDGDEESVSLKLSYFTQIIQLLNFQSIYTGW